MERRDDDGIVAHIPDRCAHVYSRYNVTFVDITEGNLEKRLSIVKAFAAKALTSYSQCQPSADHLFRLIQFNVINSLTQNAVILGLKDDWIVCASISPFGFIGPSDRRVSSLPSCPENLIPTTLQQRIPHHPWIDLFPLPKMRDNFLIAISQRIISVEEEQQLWDDLVESWGGNDWTGMLVWGEPWNPQNWEVTVTFLKRWGWLLKGCDELIEASNQWRRQRGERSLSAEIWQMEDCGAARLSHLLQTNRRLICTSKDSN